MRLGPIDIRWRPDRPAKHRHSYEVVAKTAYMSITGPRTILTRQCSCSRTYDETVRGILPGAILL